jgi:hypothetical protein
MPVHACGSRCAREGPSSEADPARGRRGPSSEADLTRERCDPSSEADLARGGMSPRARRTSLEGAFCWAASVGRGARHGVDRIECTFCVRPKVGFAFYVFFAGFKQDSPSFLGDPVAVPDKTCPRYPPLAKPEASLAIFG